MVDTDTFMNEHQNIEIQDIFGNIDEVLYLNLAEQWETDPAHMYNPPLELITKSKKNSYFNETDDDILKVKILSDFNALQINKKSKSIMENQAMKFYFEKIYKPLTFPPETMKRMTAIFRAVRDVSHETRPGALAEKVLAGHITDYVEEDLKIAQQIYKQMVMNDIETGFVSLEILKLSRDPITALDNLNEKKDPLNPGSMDEN